MNASDVKCRRFYVVQGTPIIGGLPAVPPEVVYVVCRSEFHARGWFVVRFEDGSRLCMHASRFAREVAP